VSLDLFIERYNLKVEIARLENGESILAVEGFL